MKKILIVEDNDMNRKLFRDILHVHNFDVIEASTGPEAIELAANETPDLIILDMQIPEISGPEVVRWIRGASNLSHTPIIAVTAFAMKADEARFLDTGVDAYLPKPISIDKFMATINQTLLLQRLPSRMAS